MRFLFSFLTFLIVLSSCDSPKKAEDTNPLGVHKVIAQEVLHVNEYSYIRVLEAGQESWIAAPTTPVEIGKTYYYGKSMEMKNFESKDLGKTFETVYFVERISENLEEATVPLTETPHTQTTTKEATKPTIEKKEVIIEAATDGISLAELFKHQEQYNNTIVT